jgi:hypothetical protein
MYCLVNKGQTSVKSNNVEKEESGGVAELADVCIV